MGDRPVARLLPLENNTITAGTETCEVWLSNNETKVINVV